MKKELTAFEKFIKGQKMVYRSAGRHSETDKKRQAAGVALMREAAAEGCIDAKEFLFHFGENK